MKRSFGFLFVLVVTFVSSCSIHFFPTNQASIRVSLGGQSTTSARSLLHLAQWQLTGAGPNGETFDTGALDFTQTVNKTDLTPGDWTFEAQGLNAEGRAVSSAMATVTLVVGQTTEIPLTLSFAPLTSDTQWKFVDGGAAKGLSHGTQNYAPSIASVGDKLYIGWTELTPQSSGLWILRVYEYNGNDDAPTWTAVDSGSTLGMNHNPAQVQSAKIVGINGALYAAWVEQTTPPTGHVSKYNGDGTWTSLTTAAGISYYTGAGPEGGVGNGALGLANVGDTLYAVWINAANGRDWLHASSYAGGTSWTPLMTSATELAEPDVGSVSALGFDGRLAVAWKDKATATLRFSTFDGTSWTTSATGLSTGTGQWLPSLATAGGKLYLGRSEWAPSGVVRVSVFDGDFSAPDWTLLDGAGQTGLNYLPTHYAENAKLVSVNGGLVVLWFEEKTLSTSDFQVRAKVFNGDAANPVWTSIDGDSTNGLNRDNAYAAVDFGGANHEGKLYVVSAEYSGLSADSLHVLRGK